MEYRNLGRTGVMVCPLYLGAMNFGSPTAIADFFNSNEWMKARVQ